jgi:hypothetical protein
MNLTVSLEDWQIRVPNEIQDLSTGVHNIVGKGLINWIKLGKKHIK